MLCNLGRAGIMVYFDPFFINTEHYFKNICSMICSKVVQISLNSSLQTAQIALCPPASCFGSLGGRALPWVEAAAGNTKHYLEIPI